MVRRGRSHAGSSQTFPRWFATSVPTRVRHRRSHDGSPPAVLPRVRHQPFPLGCVTGVPTRVRHRRPTRVRHQPFPRQFATSRSRASSSRAVPAVVRHRRSSAGSPHSFRNGSPSHDQFAAAIVLTGVPTHVRDMSSTLVRLVTVSSRAFSRVFAARSGEHLSHHRVTTKVETCPVLGCFESDLH